MVSGAAIFSTNATFRSAKAIKLSRCAIPLGISTLIRCSTPMLRSFLFYLGCRRWIAAFAISQHAGLAIHPQAAGAVKDAVAIDCLNDGYAQLCKLPGCVNFLSDAASCCRSCDDGALWRHQNQISRINGIGQVLRHLLDVMYFDAVAPLNLCQSVMLFSDFSYVPDFFHSYCRRVRDTLDFFYPAFSSKHSAACRLLNRPRNRRRAVSS